MSSISTMMARQRALREAKQAEEAQKARDRHETSAPDFFDNIDTSDGTDACHLWTGQRRWNHPSTYEGERYESPIFEGYEGCDSNYAARVMCFATFGVNVPADMDVSTICGNRLCCNLKHLAVVKHGGCGDSRMNKAVPAHEFFRCEAA